MKVIEAMSRNVRVAEPNNSLKDVAKIMAEIGSGVVPVAENDRLVGMITDRDIALRAVARGKGPETLVRDAMSPDVKYCYDHEDLTHIARNMSDQQIRRLPVVNKNKRLVGIISLGDLSLAEDAAVAGDALCGISQPNRVG
jgi:CBS domain-containing protein